MLLRTRIILGVCLMLGLLGGVIVALGWQQSTAIGERYAAVAISGQSALWSTLSDTETERLSQVVNQLLSAAQPALTDTGDQELAQAATSLIAARVVSDVQLLDGNGRILYAGSTVAEPRRILDAATIQTVMRGEPIAGLRQVDADRYLIVAATAINLGPNNTGVLTVGSPVNALVSAFGSMIGGHSYLVSLRRQVAVATDPDLWAATSPDLPLRAPSIDETATADRRFTLTGLPLPDMSRGQAGLLVTINDTTVQSNQARLLNFYALIAVAVVLAATVLGLYVFMRISFQPFNTALDALSQLAAGNTNIGFLPAGDDEIGRVAKSVETFRQKLSDLADTDLQREVMRRRQERFIRRRMMALAETLDDEAQAAITTDLQSIVSGEQLGDQETNLKADDQLGPLAAVMNSMSSRVIEQNDRLRELIARLQDALIRETKLAGLEQELAIATELQQSILPVDFPDESSHSLRASMVSAKEVGGDFYDFFTLPDGRIGLVIADISGKGVPAAFFMAICRTLLKSIAQFETSTARTVEKLNTLLAADNEQMMFATCFYAVVEPDTGVLTYTNAGHNAPVLLTANGRCEMVEGARGMALAVMEDMPYEEAQITLPKEASFILYTDGVTEGMNEAGEIFGDDRLLESTSALGYTDPAKIVEHLMDAVHKHEDGAPQADDITVLVFNRL